MAAGGTDLHIETPCGGGGTCGKCKAIVSNPASAPNETELRFLSDEDIKLGVRLICQCYPNADSVVTAQKTEQTDQILSDALDSPLHISPSIRKIYLGGNIWENSKRDGARSLTELLEETLEIEALNVSLPVFRDLSGFLTGNHSPLPGVTVLLRGDKLLGAEEGDTTGELYGVAVDIGTTTVAAYLLNLATGEVVGVASCLNPQIQHGADVVARIAYASEEAENLTRQSDEIIGAINKLAGELAEGAALSRERILHAVITGNTTMEHLALGISPRDIGIAPFLPGFRFLLTQDAQEAGIALHPRAGLDLLPNISGYIGGDTTAGVYYSQMAMSEDISLLVDIGTNNEVVIGNKDRILACSTAAGPALEGARIWQGMRGTAGAIERVKIRDGKVLTTVIGGGKALGICGSGVIDVLAEMLENRIIDPGGKIQKTNDDERLASLIGRNEKGQLCFQISKDVVFSQKDVREAQLAKAAIGLGIAVLLEEAGIKPGDVSRLYLAGAFGNYIDIDNAIKIGLLPPLPRERIIPLGNAAGKGACAALLNTQALSAMRDIARRARHIELTSAPNFMDAFMSRLAFKRTDI